jgi:hypothetical protein
MQTLLSERSADSLVIGSGIAAASLAYWLAPHARVIELGRSLPLPQRIAGFGLTADMLSPVRLRQAALG